MPKPPDRRGGSYDQDDPLRDPRRPADDPHAHLERWTGLEGDWVGRFRQVVLGILGSDAAIPVTRREQNNFSREKWALHRITAPGRAGSVLALEYIEQYAHERAEAPSRYALDVKLLHPKRPDGSRRGINLYVSYYTGEEEYEPLQFMIESIVAKDAQEDPREHEPGEGEQPTAALLAYGISSDMYPDPEGLDNEGELFRVLVAALESSHSESPETYQKVDLSLGQLQHEGIQPFVDMNHVPRPAVLMGYADPALRRTLAS